MEVIKYNSLYDLNKKFNILNIIEEYHVEFKNIISKIISQMLANEDDLNFYYINSIINQNIIFKYEETINYFYQIISSQIDSILDSLHVPSDDNYKEIRVAIDISTYLFIWKNYIKLVSVFNQLLFNHPDAKKLVFNYLLVQYYNRVLTADSLASQLFFSIDNINKNNIDTFIEFINSLLYFNKVKENIDLDSITKNIVKLIDNNVINICCEKINKILCDSQDKSKIKFYRKILFYTDKTNLSHYYHYFLQIRLLDKSYKDYIEDINLVNLLFKYNKNLLRLFLYMIKNIMDNRLQINMIQGVNVINTTMTIKELPDVRTSNPIILYEKYWHLDNVYKAKINYPSEMNSYFLIFNKFYKDKFNQEVTWLPLLGDVLVEANIGKIAIQINCNIFQCICMMHFNSYPESSINLFSEKYNIDKKLSKKIFDSLLNANILVFSLHDSYTVNNNYQDSKPINIIPLFE